MRRTVINNIDNIIRSLIDLPIDLLELTEQSADARIIMQWFTGFGSSVRCRFGVRTAFLPHTINRPSQESLAPGSRTALQKRKERTMSIIRPFRADDLFKFNNINLDIWTETVRTQPAAASGGGKKIHGSAASPHAFLVVPPTTNTNQLSSSICPYSTASASISITSPDGPTCAAPLSTQADD